MAILKHLTNKSSNYGKALEYLMFRHNEYTQKPVLDDNGNMQLREELYIDGLNCQPLTFAKECEILNARYHKNQTTGEVKSHHYIISFDPRDVSLGLTGEKAQEIGLEFARKYFTGHQALVCTHTDGHNRSGNIHVHIVINSLRKFDVEHQDFMERDYDCRAGYKHHQTRKYLTAMQEGLMSICEREHLHQVDLVSPAADKVTEREYWKEKREKDGQDRSETNGNKSNSRQSSFQTQKQFLRNAIQEVSSYANSPEEFGEELRKHYGITFKVSRGRFSYLHPDRSKYITGRNLGDNYTERYLLPLFDGNKAAGRTRNDMLPATSRVQDENAPGKKDRKTDAPTYDPSYDYAANPVAALHFRTKLRLVVDLQNCAKAQASRAYARKVKMSNLQQMAQTICFVQEHGIDSRQQLDDLLSQKESVLQNTNPYDQSVKALRQECKTLRIICSNVDIMIRQDTPQQQHRYTEKAQDLQ